MMARTSSRTMQATTSRRTRANISYAESESDASEKEGNSRPTARQQAARNRIATKRGRESPTEAENDTKLRKRKRSKHQVQSSILNQAQPIGIIPPWQTLPYEILLQIFKYAAHPIIDMETFHPTASTKWLLMLARLCKAFAEPALTALYASPPLIPMVKAHMLVDLLNADPSTTMFKYRAKIESLLIEVNQVAAYSLPGSGVLDLEGMVRHLPRLKALEFYHKKDFAPYHYLQDTIRWKFPQSLFEALEHVDPNADATRGDKIGVCKLKSWRWSSRLTGKNYSFNKLRELHEGPTFSSLQKLAFVNYHGPEDPSEWKSAVTAFGNCVKVLCDLQHLILESCDLVGGELLYLLPTNLRNLEIVNCPHFDADELASFLISHGSQLQSLTLEHNEYLNLAFLAVFSEACKSLQRLRINNVKAHYKKWYWAEGEKMTYKVLTDFDPIPWPRTLRSIELTNILHMSVAEGELIFQSLLASAQNLPDLRILIFEATIDASWKDRAKFREKWVKKLTRVFKYVPKAVSSFLPSSSTKLVPEPHRNQNIEVVILNKRRSSRPSMPIKRMEFGMEPCRKTRRPTRCSARQSQQEEGRYAESSDNPESETGDYSSNIEDISPADQNGKHRGKMMREVNGLAKFLPDINPIPVDSVSSASSESEIDINNQDESELDGLTSARPSYPKHSKPSNSERTKQFIQGRCDIVSIRIDNQRPAERQVTEADFLDAEPSGDEDWNEDEEGDDDLYAW